MRAYVLDACALVAYLRDEAGGAKVADLLACGHPVHMGAVNLLEVCYDAERREGDRTGAVQVIECVAQLGIEVVWAFDEADLLAASTFKARGRLSLADALALALARRLNARLVTADHHEFDALDKAGLALFEWIR